MTVTVVVSVRRVVVGRLRLVAAPGITHPARMSAGTATMTATAAVTATVPGARILGRSLRPKLGFSLLTSPVIETGTSKTTGTRETTGMTVTGVRMALMGTTARVSQQLPHLEDAQC